MDRWTATNDFLFSSVYDDFIVYKMSGMKTNGHLNLTFKLKYI